ncbi:hypothetical protein ADUPG1_000142, partial [Aduncisulcus paluster]
MIKEPFDHFADYSIFFRPDLCLSVDVPDSLTIEKPSLKPFYSIVLLGLSVIIFLRSMIFMGIFPSVPLISVPYKRMASIDSLFFIFAFLTVLQSVYGECDTGYSGDNCQYGFSVECGRYLSEDDHLECTEISSGRYAAECESGYYFDESTLSCVLDSGLECSAYIDGNYMCIFEDGGDAPELGCRVEWYGDTCDDMFSVHIPDQIFREKGCEAYGYADALCDLTEFEMATFSGSIDLGYMNIKTFEGAQKLINISEFYCHFTDITSVAPFSALSQLYSLHPYQTDDTDYSTNVYDISSLYVMNRLYYVDIAGNESIYDISVLFRNIGIAMLPVANTDYTIARIPICRSETDTEYQTFLSAVFATFDTNSSSLDQYYLPNSCPLNDDAGNTPYYCDPDTYDQCPSVVLNEVYNSLDGVDSKECAFIAKEGDSGECYTVHDDELRTYLSDETNSCLTADDIETNGIISVATLRSALTCTSLSLSDIVSYSSNISDVTELTTLQGLEYATSLTSLTLDGYDLSGDTNSNAEYDKLVVQILAKAVSYSNDYGSIDSGLTSLSVSG